MSSGGGCSLAIITRCCTAWGMFKKLLPILTSKHISLTVRGKVFESCVRSALLHGGETWAPTAPDLQRLHRNDRSMIRWICGNKQHDEISIDVLCARLGIQEVTAALRSKRLRWYGPIFIMYQVCHQYGGSMFKSARETKKDMVRLCKG